VSLTFRQTFTTASLSSAIGFGLSFLPSTVPDALKVFLSGVPGISIMTGSFCYFIQNRDSSEVEFKKEFCHGAVSLAAGVTTAALNCFATSTLPFWAPPLIVTGGIAAIKLAKDRNCFWNRQTEGALDAQLIELSAPSCSI